MPDFSKLIVPLVKPAVTKLAGQLGLSKAVREGAEQVAPRFGKEVEFKDVMNSLSSDELNWLIKNTPEGMDLNDMVHNWVAKVSPGTELRVPGVYESVNLTENVRHPRLNPNTFRMTPPASSSDRRLIELLRSRGYDPKRNQVGNEKLNYSPEDTEMLGTVLHDYNHALPEDVMSMALRNTLPKGLWVFRGDRLDHPTFNVTGNKVTSNRPASFSVDPLLAHRTGILHAMRLNRRQPGVYNLQNDLNAATEGVPYEREAILGPVSGRVRHQGEVPRPGGGRRPFIISDLE